MPPDEKVREVMREEHPLPPEEVDHNPHNCKICRDHFDTPQEIKEEIDEKEKEMTQSQSEVERELPEEQQKEEWDGDEDNLPSIIHEADELRESMEDISYRTNPDGTVDGIVKAIHMTKTGGTIAVDIDLPAEHDLERFHFTKPKAWTYNYEFVRFVESYGQRASSITSMIEDGVKVKVRETEDEYELVMPKTRDYYLSKTGNIHKGWKNQGHPIWKIIPTGAGLLSSLYFQSTISIVPSIGMGVVVMLLSGLALLIIGEHLLGWPDD